MKRTIVAAAVMWVAIAAPGHAAKPAAPSYDCEAAKGLPAEADGESRRIACEIPGKYQEDVSIAEFMGKLIRLHDMAAWLTTDALVEKKAFDGMQGQGRGWLTRLVGEDVDVRFFAERNGLVEAFASARLDVDPFKVVQARKLAPPDPMTSDERRLMRAKMLVLANDEVTLCTNHTPNTVVFESDEDGKKEILVFVMSAWIDDAAPLGGYHMFRVSEDGETILSHFSQTKACPMADAKGLGETESLMVSHLNSATPTMFHVFMGLQYRKPLYVATTQNGLLWRVDRGQIFLVEQDPAPQAETTAPAGKGTTSHE